MAQLIHELVERIAARAPSSTALRHGAGRVSYAGLAAGMTAVAAALAGGGAGRDDRVACCLAACPESVALLLGAFVVLIFFITIARIKQGMAH